MYTEKLTAVISSISCFVRGEIDEDHFLYLVKKEVKGPLVNHVCNLIKDAVKDLLAVDRCKSMLRGPVYSLDYTRDSSEVMVYRLYGWRWELEFIGELKTNEKEQFYLESGSTKYAITPIAYDDYILREIYGDYEQLWDVNPVYLEKL